MSEDSEGHGREQTQGTILVPARYAGITNAGIPLRHIVSSRLSQHIDNPTSRFLYKAETTGAKNHTLNDLKNSSGMAVCSCVGSDTVSSIITAREPDAGTPVVLSMHSLYTVNKHTEKNVMRHLMQPGGITKR
jgi:hypothetical protein